MTRMSFDNMSTLLIDEFPELRERYDNEREWWGNEEPGQHVVFGDIFTPHLVKLLRDGTDAVQLERGFTFIERLLTHDDIRVQEVAVVTVLEHLQGKPDLLNLAAPYLGPNSRKALKDLAQFWEEIKTPHPSSPTRH